MKLDARTRPRRAFATHELAARAWHYLSPFPHERGIAARKYRELAGAVPDDERRLLVVGELAVDGYHAWALTPRAARGRAARIGFRREAATHEANAALVRSMIASLASKMRRA